VPSLPRRVGWWRALRCPLATVMKGNSLIGLISASRLLELALQPSQLTPVPGREGGVMAVVAVLVFVAAYILIATERVPKMVTALVGASIILGLGVARRRTCSTPTRPASLSSRWAGVSGGDQSHTSDGRAARAERGGRGNLVPCLRSSVLHHRRILPVDGDLWPTTEA
jgi:hypothetical protein